MNINLKQYASMATTVLTALGVLYTALSQIWGLPYGSEVANTTLAIAAFIASVLGLNTAKSVVSGNKGEANEGVEGGNI
ncbi:phage holin [Lactococcus garvieae]|uniref:Putative phage holin Dp-1 n=1 Tax=Lactococcus garvieae TaxID=1363 RepID=A0A1I4FID4_9LACT|nr:phage holin [Lactococcus garvieae]SFL17682.1 Putative phage holin Dp-1 [Lactococcus garvieae]